MEKTLDAYRSLIQLLGNGRGEAIDVGSRDREKRRALRSAARSVLPNATATVIVVTANARAIRHFLKVRGQIEGDAEMREVCAALLQAVGPDAPAIFGDFVVEKLADDTPIVRHQPKG
jgi:thymidylate synthase (FAD)